MRNQEHDFYFQKLIKERLGDIPTEKRRMSESAAITESEFLEEVRGLYSEEIIGYMLQYLHGPPKEDIAPVNLENVFRQSAEILDKAAKAVTGAHSFQEVVAEIKKLIPSEILSQSALLRELLDLLGALNQTDFEPAKTPELKDQHILEIRNPKEHLPHYYTPFEYRDLESIYVDIVEYTINFDFKSSMSERIPVFILKNTYATFAAQYEDIAPDVLLLEFMSPVSHKKHQWVIYFNLLVELTKIVDREAISDKKLRSALKELKHRIQTTTKKIDAEEAKFLNLGLTPTFNKKIADKLKYMFLHTKRNSREKNQLATQYDVELDHFLFTISQILRDERLKKYFGVELLGKVVSYVGAGYFKRYSSMYPELKELEHYPIPSAKEAQHLLEVFVEKAKHANLPKEDIRHILTNFHEPAYAKEGEYMLHTFITEFLFPLMARIVTAGFLIILPDLIETLEQEFQQTKLNTTMQKLYDQFKEFKAYFDKDVTYHKEKEFLNHIIKFLYIDTHVFYADRKKENLQDLIRKPQKYVDVLPHHQDPLHPSHTPAI